MRENRWWLLFDWTKRIAHWPAVPAHLHVYVDSVDETYRRALDAGGVSVQPPQQKGQDPDRRGGGKDAAGNTLWIATQLGSGCGVMARLHVYRRPPRRSCRLG